MFEMRKSEMMWSWIELVCATAKLRFVGDLSSRGHVCAGQCLEERLLSWRGDYGSYGGLVNVDDSV